MSKSSTVEASPKINNVLPPFPATMHIPWKPNTTSGDVVAQDSECQIILESENILVEEKVDGASVGFGFAKGHPIIRNREHMLLKGFVGRTPAKKQFASIWNYYYQHAQERFNKLFHLGPYSVYGEWMVMQHGIHYTKLPDLFIAYDIWNYQQGFFLPFEDSRRILDMCGFSIPAILYRGKINDFAQIENMTHTKSAWADSEVEGAYIRVSDGHKITHRFKMVREGFEAGALWDKTEVKKNTLEK